MKRKQKACSRWKNRIFGVLLLSCCFVSLLVVQVQYSRIRPFTSFQKPKIAFLFIARNRLPVDLIWDAFFQGAKEPAFSIYIHSRPGFVFNKVTTRCPLFYGCQLNDSIQVDWGESSMIEAERILLRNALKDSLNERFVFLSDSFADTKEGRYNPKMDPLIPVVSWRKGSQWAVLTRKHAKVVAEDDTVISVFHQHCKRRSLPEFWRDHSLPTDASKEHNCIPDEHYVQTLLALKGLEAELTRRPLTHTVWDMSSKDHERRGWHPVTYKHSDATPQLIHDIKSIDNIHYETEYRKEWCTNKGMSAPCFLFARKFTRNAAIHLLTHMKYAGEHDDDAESEMRSL
ncbi:uncharacterized protein LOC18430789 isoform X2 [Amborella trichopoda]|uniref:uncharacterized protein LOC18430789 isoform X2 n=1 Tax=Amborella trichopoda TaxID=13333 RepID=UPI0009BFB197|nr:uncharacterized protein LOC18430789 isoform X2 [Amborella trichopoda]|eukprot:XP_020520818.1 uncharacterized protein LOC18430789 isoform X2 [Amborella trichopoda]